VRILLQGIAICLRDGAGGFRLGLQRGIAVHSRVLFTAMHGSTLKDIVIA
jgi:hypothetical protein